jgi:hypothetical protein
MVAYNNRVVLHPFPLLLADISAAAMTVEQCLLLIAVYDP